MIVGYAYTAMLVTGILHCVLGFSAFVTSICGMLGVELAGYIIRVYNGIAFVTAIWIILVGSLGITAGLKQLSDDIIRKFKIAYMVTAILSACIFSLVGLTMFCLTFTVAIVLDKDWENFVTIGHVGSVIMALEFVLAIVSSSICCCCSNSSPNTTVIIQAPGRPVETVMQYQTREVTIANA